MGSPQVFVSYDHRDKGWIDKTLIPILSKAGLTFRHDSQIHYGTSIYEWIDSSRSECKAFIMVISKSYIQNRSYARAEMTDLVVRGLKGRLRVIPLFKETVDEDDLPFGIPSLNAIKNLESLDSQIEALAAQLKGERPSVASIGSTDDCFVPPERRIRIQASTLCTQECPWCHWDQFPDDIEANYRLVLKLMIRLKEALSLDVVTYPRPNIGFALTGGEPLAIKDSTSSSKIWRKLAAIDPHNTFLLTNGRLLDYEAVSFIRAKGVKQIRIDLPLIPPTNYRGIQVKPDYGTLDNYFEKVLDQVDNLLETADVEVRFNYVVTDGNVKQFDDYLNFIRKRFKKHIGHKVKGVAFIEHYSKTKHDDLDVFKVAKQWAHHAGGLILYGDPLVQRKTAVTTTDNMLIEFTKLNCALTEDLISRCFMCVQEQDIAISADGRIRICPGWDVENQEGCNPVFAHFEATQPLVGISGVIRRRYGIAGFYNHFSIISNIINGMDFPEFFRLSTYQFSPDSFMAFLQEWHISLSEQEIRDYGFIPTLAEKIIGELSPFRRLYEEGTYDQIHLSGSTRLCVFLLRAAYSLAIKLREENTLKLKASLNAILLILEYLCVDENLFSTGRTLIVQGMSTDLLKNISSNDLSHDFLCDSTYCLSTVAFENCDANVVLQFLNSQVPDEYLQDVAWIQYLVGCVHRQSGQENAAIKALELAYSISDRKLHDGSSSRFTWLLREIRAEAKRSLGAIRKGRDFEFEQAQEDFTLANFLSSVDNTKLRYAALYSDGYASMLKHFREELESETSYKEAAYKAHRDFSESIALNPTFYASLIRMGLLELTLGYDRIASERLRVAKRSFSKRGLLTDQEYLNSILCDLISIIAADDAALYANRPQVGSLGITDCKNAGKRDVLCVQEDANFLLMYINKICDEKKRDKLNNAGIINDIKTFIEKCDNLLGVTHD